MADFLNENGLLFQSSYTSSSFYFSNFSNSNDDFEKAIQASEADKFNIEEMPDYTENQGSSYTRIVSATIMTQNISSASSGSNVAFSYQGNMQKFEIRIDVNGEERKYTATGIDKDGNEFSKEIDPYDVDPTDADFTEFAALCSYICNTESIADEAMKGLGAIAPTDILEKMDYLSTFSTEIGKFELVGLNNLSTENWMTQINQLMDELMNTHSEESDDWRKMTEDEWEKLMERVDADIDDMIEQVKEESEEIKEEQLEEELVNNAIEV